jgi:peptide/nickel transport system substrate-binding protein
MAARTLSTSRRSTRSKRQRHNIRRCAQASARFALAAAALVSIVCAGCQRGGGRSATATSDQVTLTIGVGQLSAADPNVGLRRMARNLAVEALANIGRDGRSSPGLAESWHVAPDGRSLVIRLRPHVKFHDGTPVTSAVIAQIVQSELPRALGPAFQDIVGVRSLSDTEIEIAQKRPSPFLSESLDFPIEKPGAVGVGTGPFSFASGPGTIEMNANNDYYLGRPVIQHIVMRSYPTARAAWADLLRDQVDMIYEVGSDALDSLQASSRVAVYPFPRTYAYVIAFNARKAIFTPRELRRALNSAIDRPALIQQALYGHGTPADGPVWPHHWAFRPGFPAFTYDPAVASTRFGGHLRFKCIFPEGAMFERLALAAQKQFATVGVEMDIQAVKLDELTASLMRKDFDAALFDAQIAPNMSRAYQWWHSGGPNNYGGFSSAKVDTSLDAVRYAANDADYAAAVLDFQRAIIEDPPAVFLAWGERVRAVSRRFEIPVEPGRDVLTALRLWKPAADARAANRN